MSDRPTFRQAIEEEERTGSRLSAGTHTHRLLACSAFALPHAAGHSSREQSLESCRNFPSSRSLSPPSLRSFVFYFVSRFYSALLNQRQPMDHSMFLFCIFLSFPFCTHTHTPLTLTFAPSLRRPRPTAATQFHPNPQFALND